MSNKLYLGTARSIITPKVGCQLYGYSPDVISTCVNDDLTATAFYFEQNGTAALMISITVGSINSTLSDEIRRMLANKLGIPTEHILLSATHTHSGPNVTGTVGWGDVDAEYRDEIFIPGLLDAACRAKENMIPVRMGIARGESKVGINRRQLNPDNTVALGQNPWGPYNPAMTVLSFADETGKITANMIHYGCHGIQDRARSGDCLPRKS